MFCPKRCELPAGERRLPFFIICCTILLAPYLGIVLYAQQTCEAEYQAKAEVVYNCLRFIVGGRFRRDGGPEPNEIIPVGVVGKIPSERSLAGLCGKLLREKRVEVRFFPSFADLKDAQGRIPERHPQIGELRKCHVLFLCSSEKPFFARILPCLQGEGILLVGDTAGFLEAGGMINLMMKEQKIRFEINLAAARRAKLQIRSSLLRLAVRTIEHDSLERRRDAGKQAGNQGP